MTRNASTLEKGWKLVRNSFERVCELIYPPVCVYCFGEIAKEKFLKRPRVELCSDCLSDLMPQYSRKCLKCGAGVEVVRHSNASVAEKDESMPDCPFCRRSNFRFESCLSLGNYELQIREAVLKCKSGSHDALTIALAKSLAGQVVKYRDSIQRDFDLIIPIPIHWRRRLGRHSVVSEMIAEEIARQMKVKCSLNGLRYNRLTVKQGTLSTTERIENVRNAISVTHPKALQRRHVILVDDVMTSGATINEAAKACWGSGARSVTAAILARGVGRSLNR